MVQQDSLFGDEDGGAAEQHLRVALYCRGSAADSYCEEQERDLLEYAHGAGFEVACIFKETEGRPEDSGKPGSGRKGVMSLAREREIDAVLVTELTRWGRSVQDVAESLRELAGWEVSLIALSGLQFDLSTLQGTAGVELMASVADFDRDLRRERVRSGIAAARFRGQTLGRPAGHRPSDELVPKVVELSESGGMSQRRIARELDISKTTVNAILKRHR